MNELVDNVQEGYDVVEDLFKEVVAFLPSLIGFVLFVIGVLLVYKLILFLSKKIFKSIDIDKFIHKNFPGLESWKFNFYPSTIILGFVKITLMLIFIVLGAEILGLTVLSLELSKLLNLVPRLLIAIVLLFVGFSISAAVRNLIYSLFNSFGLAGARLISKLIGYLILFIILLIAVELVGIDTSIITNNISIILAAILICISLAVGLGSVEIVKRILFGFYFKKNFRIGQHIQFENISGRIIKMDNINIVLKRDEGKMVIPVKDLVDARITIIRE